MPRDPITTEIIQNSLQAIADEMFAAMKKTAMSSIIYEVLDMGTGITDAAGEIASSGAGIPAFVGVLDKAVKVILARHEAAEIREGDVFATNDPYYGGVTHLNDIIVAMPVFAEGRLIGWTANIAHNSDVGGMAPGSLTGDATEIFQEGLRLPAIKLIDAGQPIRSVLDIVKVNSRMPDVLEGDVWAAISSVRIGARRLQELAGKYGVETYLGAVEDFMDFGEAVTLRSLEGLAHGTFELDEEQDDGRIFNVKITIAADRFTVDLRDNPDQSTGPVNTSRDGVMVAAQMMVKSLTDPRSPANGGSFRPIALLTRPGSVFHAEEPAPIGFYYEIELRVYDLMWRCLAPHVPNLLGAGHFASVCGTFIGGTHPDTGRQYTIIEPQVGGWGAGGGRDGNSAIFCAFHGETYNCPAEINEARNGVVIGRMELNTGPGGEGRETGGRGVVIDYLPRADDGYLTVGYTRSRFPAWGLDGGRDGSPNLVRFLPAGGEAQDYAFVSGLKTRAGDVIRVITGNGGGQGDPRERDPDKVRRDLRDGLLTPERGARGLRGRGREGRDMTDVPTAARMAALRERMAETGAELMALGPGPHTEWLLGFHPHADERPCLLLIGPQREAFLMPKLNADAAREQSAIEMLTWDDADGPDAALGRALKASGGTGARRVVLDETMRADFALLLLGHLPGASHAFGDATIGALRMRKDAGEKAALKAEAAIADAAMRAGWAAMRPGMTEAEVADAIRESFGAQGARPLFTIVGAGRNGAFPHHPTGATVLREGDAVVMDIGAARGSYSSDITRMAAIGHPPEGYAEVHAVVEAAVTAAMAAARPGALAREVDAAARSTIAAAGYGDFFLHRTGHGLGIEVHEPPYLTSASGTVLEEGMVFSIEPGIYLPNRFGIRLEEIVYLTAEGPEILSALPRDLEVVG